ncbi:MAG: hypothetical protein WAO00_11045 [Chthoniobacterales bacterium]
MAIPGGKAFSTRALGTFLKQLLETKGRDALRQLKPEHLRWIGLSPERAAEVIHQLQSVKD